MPFNPAWIPLIATGADFLLRKLDSKGYGGQADLPDMQALKDEMFMSDSEARDLKRSSLRDIGQLVAKGTSDVKQVGAARRMPSGAIASGIGNVAHKGATAAAGIGPQVKSLQKRTNMNAARSLFPYANLGAQQEYNKAYQDQATLGSLAKIAMLWKGGFFDQGANTGSVGDMSLKNIMNENIQWGDHYDGLPVT